MEVIRKFKDTDKRVYDVGDTYPHKDAKKPTKKRIGELSTINNKVGEVFIRVPSNEL